MTSQDFLFYSLGTGFLILVGFLSYAAYNLGESLKRVSSALKKIDDIAQDADDFKNAIKSKILNFTNIFSKKGGEKMTNKTNKKGVNPTTAGLVGAAIGAAVGATAGVLLSDEKNRDQIKNKIGEIKEEGQKLYSDVKKKSGELSNEAKGRVTKAGKALKG